MGEFQPNPNVAARIFYARQKTNTPQLHDNLIGNNLMQSRNFNFNNQRLMVKEMVFHMVKQLIILYNKNCKKIHIYVECIHIHQI